MTTLIRLFCMLAMSGALLSQDASSILQRLTTKMNRVQDYTVQAQIRPDIPMITIQPVTATLYYKQKDKFRIVSPGIALLPKQGFMDVTRLLLNKDRYTAILGASDMLGNKKAQLVTLLPLSDTADIIVAKLWIESGSDLLLKAQITTRSSGTIGVEYSYGSQRDFALPDAIIFTVDIRKFKLPKGVATDINRSNTSEAKKAPATNGTITIQLRDYIINKGVSDDVFSK